jgi:asparagine synthase (glutamine-hydrolysing)
MCGIVGEVRFDRRPVDRALLHRMCESITHRGPDEDGFFVQDQVGLAMRRLSIVDLAGGSQPISNEAGDVTVVYNGEIYNAPELLRGLAGKGHVLGSRCDTEVLVHLYEDLGPGLLQELRGMFAFALWDRQRRSVLVARDRLGIKPLYYKLEENRVLFASELKAILVACDTKPPLDPEALDAFLAHHYIPAPLTIFSGIRKLPAGHYLEIRDGRLEEKCYWSVENSIEPTDPGDFDENRAVARLRSLLEDAVQEHLMADVPLGVFLSGGIDSSIIAALAAAKTAEPVRTFSIRFEHDRYDESPYARAVADHIGARHTEETVSVDVIDLLPRLVEVYDEPFADQAALPGYSLAEVAARELKVCLSGDGGDELFAGYRRYSRVLAMQRFDRIPAPLRTLASRLKGVVPPHLRGRGFLRRLGSPAAVRYQMEFDGFDATARQQLVASEHRRVGDDGSFFANIVDDGSPADLLRQMQIADVKHYLPECILAKVDRISMAHSLEVRVPLLDHRVVEAAFSLPQSAKLRGDDAKWILKQACKDLLPARILTRPKRGFSVPLTEWFRDDLRSHAEEVLLGRRAIDRGILRKRPIQQLIERHDRGRKSFAAQIYSLLIFEYWCQAHLD